MVHVTHSEPATSTIRSYQASDSREVLRLLAAYDAAIREMLPPTDYRLEALRDNGLEIWLEELLRGDSQILVAEADNGLAGVIFGKVDSSPQNVVNKWGALGSIYVDERQRHRGVAKALYEAMESWFASRGCTTMCVDTWLANTGGIETYKRLGFRELTLGFVKTVAPS